MCATQVPIITPLIANVQNVATRGVTPICRSAPGRGR